MSTIKQMKIIKPLALAVLSVGLIVGFSRVIISKSKTRLPASEAFQFTERNKVHAPIQATLEIAGDIPENEEDFVEVKAIVSGRADLLQEGFHYRWTIPADAVVQENPLEGDSVLATNGTQIISLRLNHFSKSQFSEITFQVEGKGTLKVANSALIVSRVEDTWEGIAPDMQKASEALENQ